MTDKIGLTIEEAADYTGIGRNTMRKLVEWEKIPVLRIGRRYIIRIDVIHTFMEANQGADLLVREQRPEGVSRLREQERNGSHAPQGHGGL